MSVEYVCKLLGQPFGCFRKNCIFQFFPNGTLLTLSKSIFEHIKLMFNIVFGFEHSFMHCGLVSPPFVTFEHDIMHLWTCESNFGSMLPGGPFGPIDTLRGRTCVDIHWFMDICMFYGERCSVTCSGREPAGRWSRNLRRDGCTTFGRGSPPETKPEYFHLWKLGTMLVHFHLWMNL